MGYDEVRMFLHQQLCAAGNIADSDYLFSDARQLIVSRFTAKLIASSNLLLLFGIALSPSLLCHCLLFRTAS